MGGETDSGLLIFSEQQAERFFPWMASPTTTTTDMEDEAISYMKEA